MYEAGKLGSSSRRGHVPGGGHGVIGGLLLASAVFIALALPESAGRQKRCRRCTAWTSCSAMRRFRRRLMRHGARSRCRTGGTVSPRIAQTSAGIDCASSCPKLGCAARNLHRALAPGRRRLCQRYADRRAALPDRPQRTVYPQYLGSRRARCTPAPTRCTCTYGHRSARTHPGDGRRGCRRAAAVRAPLLLAGDWRAVLQPVRRGLGVFSLLLCCDCARTGCTSTSACPHCAGDLRIQRLPAVPPAAKPLVDALFALAAIGKLFMMALFAACYAGIARPWSNADCGGVCIDGGSVGTFDLNAWISGSTGTTRSSRCSPAMSPSSCDGMATALLESALLALLRRFTSSMASITTC